MHRSHGCSCKAVVILAPGAVAFDGLVLLVVFAGTSPRLTGVSSSCRGPEGESAPAAVALLLLRVRLPVLFVAGPPPLNDAALNDCCCCCCWGADLLGAAAGGPAAACTVSLPFDAAVPPEVGADGADGGMAASCVPLPESLLQRPQVRAQ